MRSVRQAIDGQGCSPFFTTSGKGKEWFVAAASSSSSSSSSSSVQSCVPILFCCCCCLQFPAEQQQQLVREKVLFSADVDGSFCWWVQKRREKNVEIPFEGRGEKRRKQRNAMKSYAQLFTVTCFLVSEMKTRQKKSNKPLNIKIKTNNKCFVTTDIPPRLSFKAKFKCSWQHMQVV